MPKPIVHNDSYSNSCTSYKNNDSPQENADGYCCLSCFNSYHEELLLTKFECSCACHGQMEMPAILDPKMDRRRMPI